ncbi:MAG: hypothetical protein LC777_05535, partial [Actinobacteria bacterium]|nr:hypothetical protein [Actinomycetota bacterium]
ALLLVVLMAVAVLRGRPRTAGTVAAVVLGANVTTQILKPLLAHPRLSELGSTAWVAGERPEGARAA